MVIFKTPGHDIGGFLFILLYVGRNMNHCQAPMVKKFLKLM